MKRLGIWKRRPRNFNRGDWLVVLMMLPCAVLLTLLATVVFNVGLIPLIVLHPEAAESLMTVAGVLGVLTGFAATGWFFLGGSYVYIPDLHLVPTLDGHLYRMRSLARGKFLKSDPVATATYREALAHRDRYVVAVSAVAKEHLKISRRQGRGVADAALKVRIQALVTAQRPFEEALAFLEGLEAEAQEVERQKVESRQASGSETAGLSTSSAETEALVGLDMFALEVRSLKETNTVLESTRRSLRE